MKREDKSQLIETLTDELKAAKYKTDELENSLNDYKIQVASAKENIAAAKVKYAEMNSTSELETVAKDVRTLVNNAQNYLVKSFNKIKSMLPDMSKGEQGDQGGDNQQPPSGKNNKTNEGTS